MILTEIILIIFLIILFVATGIIFYRLILLETEMMNLHKSVIIIHEIVHNILVQSKLPNTISMN